MKTHSELARRHLDARFQQIPRWDFLTCPQKGWLRAIRDALGMTAEQVAQRLGVSKPRISTMEKDELRGALTLATMERAAKAMGCRFVYAIVPDESLQSLVEKQARRKATAILSRTSHTMGLEQQTVNEQERQAQLMKLTSDLLAKESSQLWDEP